MQISIEELTDGVHQINLEGDPNSITIPDEEVSFTTPLSIKGTLTVNEDSIILQATLSTQADLECSRCLKPIKVPISGKIAVLYEKSDRVISDPKDISDGDDVEILDYDTKSLGISHRIEELVQLVLPVKPLCSLDCKGLCSICGINFNEATCTCKSARVDPRWDVLQALLKEE